ncbi:Ribonuclease H-like domain protein [Rutstroemia sp. NJR-2017a WRK4]|nr:Ribonuclease H-like domain protein [Rutstroemia sp. NJR-2017a WRK4]
MVKITQIKRIKYLIYLLVYFQYLELISSFKFPFWVITLYSVEISKLSKELEAENYKNSAILLVPNQYSIYTNRSELENQKGIGIGLALFNSNQELIQESSWNIGTNNSELAGIAKGIKLVNKIAQKDQEFIIFSDNQTVLQRLKSLTNLLSLASYLKIFKLSSRKRIQILISTKRATASTFYQLKIRYSYLKSYLYLLEYTSTNKYICGVKEIPKYLFLSCSYFSLARNKLKDKLVTNYLLLPLLLDTTSGIEASIAYLSEINICTRKYYLARELVND